MCCVTEAATNYLPTSEMQTSANIKSFLAGSKAAVMTQCDRNSRIEKLFFSHFVDSNAQAHFQQVVLECLPTNAAIGIPEAQQLLRNMAATPLYSFVGAGLQAILT